MAPKLRCRILVDIVMTLLLLFLMGYHIWGEPAHEWFGAAIFLLFLAHHILNRQWYKNLFRGKYTPVRILQVLVNILLLMTVAVQVYSGIILSRFVFDFLPIHGGMALARKLHILGSYWGYVLMSLHLGLHWGMMLGLVKKHIPAGQGSPLCSGLCTLCSLLIAGYGVWVFIKRDLADYLFLRTEFVFMDFIESTVLFYLDYLAIMGLFIFISYYLLKLFRILQRKRSKEGTH